MNDARQPDLFDTVAHARHADPDTSHAAAQSVKTTDLQQRVLVSLRTHGDGTTVEIAKRLGLERDSVSPRIKPLVAKGLVFDTGQRKVAENGRSRIVWRAAP